MAQENVTNDYPTNDYLTNDFIRYLAAKKTVDDRALNRHVWDTLLAYWPRGSAERPCRILEIGAGIGTMVQRLHEHYLLHDVAYTAVDAMPANIQEASRRLDALPLTFAPELEAGDLFDFVRREQGRRQWDLLIAHAFLDLMDVPRTLPQLFSLLRPGGMFYFTINFDGATILQPSIEPAFDALVEALYHRTMDERLTNGQPSGDSQTGRHLFAHLRQAGADILAAGSSDWVVYAGPDGYYGDEAYFLHFIVQTMQSALTGHPELNPQQFAAWIARRHAQIESGELVYIAHQLDFVGLKREA